MSGHLDDNLREPLRPGDPGYRPPGPPDPPYIPGDMGAPSAEEFARRRGDVVQCSRCGQFSPPVPAVDDVAAAWVEAECEVERGRDMIERAWSLISEVMALAQCSQTQEWLVYAKAWQHDYENGGNR